MTETVTEVKYMDGNLRHNLDRAKRVIKEDWDMLFLVDGMEGSGKSVMAQQIGGYCDPTLNIERVTFTPEEFRNAIMEATAFQCVIYDEAYTGLSSRATMSRINRTLVSMLAEIRQKNLFVIVVMPTFFDLDKYVALWRSRALIHVYTGDNFQRGFFAFYNIDTKKDLYVNGKKFYNYRASKSNFYGRFTNWYAVDKEEYRQKKRHSLTRRIKQQMEAEFKAAVEEALITRVIEIGDALTHKKKMEILDMKPATYYRRLKDWQEKMDNEEYEEELLGIHA